MKRGWRYLQCSCTNGVFLGVAANGEPAIGECTRCGGQGYYYLHEQSQRLARKPGGPFLGQQKHTSGGDAHGRDADTSR